MKLGVNHGGGQSYYDGRQMGDLAKQAGGLGDTGWPRRPETSLRPDGFPTRVGPETWKPGPRLSQGEPLPAGDYRISAEGRGRININLDGWTKQVYLDFDGPRRGYTVRVETPKPAATVLGYAIQASDEADPLRGLSILAPDADDATPFTRQAVDDLRGFSVLRFMDARRTNSSTLATWPEYLASTALYTNSSRGLTYSDCCRLCNAIGADAYFTLPFFADAEFLAALAGHLDAELRPGATIYVEFCNEVWNTKFKQFGWSQADRNARDPRSPLTKHQGRLAAEAVNAFKAALPPSRPCVRVIGAQSAWHGNARETFEGAAAAGGFDAIASAPYFDGRPDGATAAAWAAEWAAAPDEAARRDVVGRLLARSRASIADLQPTFAAWKGIADRFGASWIWYEGGQHISPAGSTALAPFYAAANRDGRMGVLYSRYLAAGADAGVDLAILYSSQAPYSNSSTWGLREWAGQGETPKARAARLFAEAGAA